MPDLWTHLIAGDRAINKLEPAYWRDAVATNRILFNLGCLGPDMFFFDNFEPWKRDKFGALLGLAIHMEHCQDFAVAYMDSLPIDDPHARERAVVYGLGLLSHWALDRVTHPFIHYFAGFRSKNEPFTPKALRRHKRMELSIDVVLAQELLGIHPAEVSIRPRFLFDVGIPAEVVQCMSKAASNVFPAIWTAQHPQVVQQSYRDMLRALVWMHDPSGYKRLLWSLFDKLTGNSILSYFYPRKVQFDYLNRDKREWCHPAFRDETSTQSFDELLDLGVAESQRLVAATINYLEKRLPREEWLTVLGNQSYNTGKDASMVLDFRYSDPFDTN